MREKVVIIGGGIGGLTAAHELIDRGFEVHVYERRATFGGKAASGRIPGHTEQPIEDGLPTEHGFRFFPGWYRHLPDTLRRIPFRGKQREYRGQTVHDNLVAISQNLLAWMNRENIPLALTPPRDLDELSTFSRMLKGLRDLKLSGGEVGTFAAKIAQIASMTEQDRLERLDGITWSQFLEADSNKSDAYTALISATTRTMVAAKATEVSAYSIGRLALRTFMDAFSTVDRVLNGTTQEKWIQPWIDHLDERGVDFHAGEELQAIIPRTNTGGPPAAKEEIAAVEFEPVAVAAARRLRRSLARIRAAAKARRLLALTRQGPGSYEATRPTAPDEPASLHRLVDLLDAPESERTSLKKELALLLGKAAVADPHKVDRDVGELDLRLARMTRSQKGRYRVEADYFIFALPLEQMAYHINNSPALRALDPSLGKLIKLSGSLDWMAGIQFYLRDPVAAGEGHIVGLDSAWGLTAIEQTRHWTDTTLPRGVQSVLSVDIADWNRLGHFVRKEDFNCTHAEIAEEVWHQLETMLNRRHQPKVLSEQMLVGGSLQKGVSYHLDDSIVDTVDRGKQGFYERARSLRFSADDLNEDFAQSYMWGPHPQFNVEPILINRVGTRALRPDADTGIRNMFLAADYVRTETDLACMEGANEAARRAVNALLEATGSTADRCELWDFSLATAAASKALRASGAAAAVGALGAARSVAAGLRDRVMMAVGRGVIAGRQLAAERSNNGDYKDRR